MRSHKFLTGCAIALPALMFLSACSRNDDTTRARTAEPAPASRTTEVAYVRFYDAYTAPVDLYFGDTKAFKNKTDRSLTSYIELPAERHEFALRDPARPTEDPLAKNNEGLSGGKHYTVIAYDDKDGKPALRVVNDDESAPDSGKAKVRIIHAAPGLEALNLYVAGTKSKIASESRFTTSSNWQQVDPVKGSLTLRTSDKRAVQIPDVQLEPGKLYTFIVNGGGNSAEKLNVTPVVDSPTRS